MVFARAHRVVQFGFERIDDGLNQLDFHCCGLEDKADPVVFNVYM